MSQLTKEILSEALNNGIIDLNDVQDKMNKKRREQLLKQHQYVIWQLKDGRWRTYISDETKKSGRRAITKTKKSDLEDIIVKSLEEADELEDRQKITLRKLYPEWLEYKGQHLAAESSLTRIETDWKKYYLDTHAKIIDKPIIEMTKLEIDKWLHQMIKKFDMTKTNYYNFSVIIRQELDYAVDLNLISDNPMRKFTVDAKLFRKTKKKADKTQVFTHEELCKIREMAWEDFVNAVKVYELAPLAVMFQFETGLRIGELCVVRYEDVEQQDHIHIQRMLRKYNDKVVDHTKTECGDRQVYLTEEAKRIIKTAKKRQKELGVEADGYIFSINGLPLRHYPVEDLYRKYCKKLGTIQKGSHKARKTYISALIDGRVNINTVREMAGHSDERTTYKNYVFDRHSIVEKNNMIENALNHKVDSSGSKVDSKWF